MGFSRLSCILGDGRRRSMNGTACLGRGFNTTWRYTIMIIKADLLDRPRDSFMFISFECLFLNILPP